MVAPLRRLAVALAVAFGLTGPLRADDLAGFHAAIETAAAHNRVALGYLRTENIDLAAVELKRLEEAWARMAERYAGNPPAPYRDGTRFLIAVPNVSALIIGASIMIDIHRPDIAAQSLQGIRWDLTEMRREVGIQLLADCVLDANGELAAFDLSRDATPDWDGGDYPARAERYRAVLMRCDGLAAPAIRADPEFRRLIDGAVAELALVAETVKARDRERFHRILSALRAYDQLLTFRHG